MHSQQERIKKAEGACALGKEEKNEHNTGPSLPFVDQEQLFTATSSLLIQKGHSLLLSYLTY